VEHPSNGDIDKLKALILKLDKIIFKLDPASGIHTNLATTLAKIEYDVSSLRNLAMGQAEIIYSRTSSSYLKRVVKSILNTMSIDDALRESRTQ
jgi:hypothetical protein